MLWKGSEHQASIPSWPLPGVSEHQPPFPKQSPTWPSLKVRDRGDGLVPYTGAFQEASKCLLLPRSASLLLGEATFQTSLDPVQTPQSTYHFCSQAEGIPPTPYDTQGYLTPVVYRPMSWIPWSNKELGNPQRNS